MKTDQQAEIVRRLHSAAGHLNAVIEMAEDSQSCEKVLHQLNAVEAALHATAIRLLAWHLHQSEAVILASPSPARRTAELKKLQSLYSILRRKPEQYTEVTK
ncbi:MAG: metal-sensitive transcriptional regulator [Chloroflexota bacterium]